MAELCHPFDEFQHTAARRRLADDLMYQDLRLKFQHTAARRRLVTVSIPMIPVLSVSTHSRPKAAGKDISVSS